MTYQTIHIQPPHYHYQVYIGESILNNQSLFEHNIVGKQVMIVTQKEIPALYLKNLLSTLAAYEVAVTYISSGERHKNLSSWRKIIANLLAHHHERSTTVIALGGGIVGDVAGFAAACYLRGVNYIQIPTTLIAQVDSAIGGKTGINHAAGKNLVGAFHHPQCVIADSTVLKTLSPREWISGLAEIIKYGLILDASFFTWLEENLHLLLQGKPDVLLHALCKSIEIKGRCVAQDDREQLGIRCLLNFGHTVGHALEALYGYRLLRHGEAVAIGMNAAAELSVDRGWITRLDYARIAKVLTTSGLPLRINRKCNMSNLFAYMKRDKKVHDGRIKFILLKSIGKAVETEVSVEELKSILPRIGRG